MTHNFKLVFLVFGAICLVACSGTTARIIKETETSMVVQGVGPTEFEAKENAQKKAEERLGEVKQTQEPECDQEIHGRGRTSGTGATRSYSSRVNTYHSCVMYFERK